MVGLKYVLQLVDGAMSAPENLAVLFDAPHLWLTPSAEHGVKI